MTNTSISTNVYPLPELVYLPVHDWQEEDTAIVIKQETAWQALQPHDLDWDIGIQLDAPTAATEQAFAKLVDECDDMGDIIYAIGGGVAVDAAKFVAKELDLPLICVPTAISDDAFLTWTSAVWRDGTARTIEAIPPEIVLLDLGVLAQAPPEMRAAGIVDVLSISTACFDWKLADQRGKTTPTDRYSATIEAMARSILQLGLDCAEAVGRGDPDGLKSIVTALAMGVQLCNLIGHTRPKEGSEHHFAYCAESLTLAGGERLHSHAELVGAGIVAMAEQQVQDVTRLRRALEAAGVRQHALPQTFIERTLRELPNYMRKHVLPYSVAWELLDK